MNWINSYKIDPKANRTNTRPKHSGPNNTVDSLYNPHNNESARSNISLSSRTSILVNSSTQTIEDRIIYPRKYKPKSKKYVDKALSPLTESEYSATAFNSPPPTKLLSAKKPSRHSSHKKYNVLFKDHGKVDNNLEYLDDVSQIQDDFIQRSPEINHSNFEKRPNSTLKSFYRENKG